MKDQEAARLAKRLADAFPSMHVGPGAIALRAEKMSDWQLEAAERAVESLIDTGRGFPTVAELREAYGAQGGKIADPTRDMSPPRTITHGDPASPLQIRELLAGLSRRLTSPRISRPDDGKRGSSA